MEAEEHTINNNVAMPAVRVSPQLIPIQLDISYHHWRLKDSFLWNKDDNSLSIEEFARRLCEDLDFPPQIFVPPIARSIRAQIEFYTAPKNLEKTDDEDSAKDKLDLNTEKRFLFKVDIITNGTRLQDYIEWEVSREANTRDPELVARSVAADLGASREVEATLAHHLRAQTLRLQQSPSDTHVNMTPLPAVSTAIRSKPTPEPHVDQLVWPMWSWPKRTI